LPAARIALLVERLKIRLCIRKDFLFRFKVTVPLFEASTLEALRSLFFVFIEESSISLLLKRVQLRECILRRIEPGLRVEEDADGCVDV